MRRQAHEHEVARQQPRACGQGLRESLQARGVEAPDRSPGRSERIVDEPRAVESALGAALAAPHVRPAQLGERRCDDRARRVQPAYVGDPEAHRRGGLRKADPGARGRCRAGLRETHGHTHRERRRVARPTLELDRDQRRAESFRDAPCSRARGALRRVHARACATTVDVAAVAQLEHARRGQRDGIGRAVRALVEQQPPARDECCARDEREHEEQRDRPDRDRAALAASVHAGPGASGHATRTRASCGSGSRSPLGTSSSSIPSRTRARVPAGAPARAAASTG